MTFTGHPLLLFRACLPHQGRAYVGMMRTMEVIPVLNRNVRGAFYGVLATLIMVGLSACGHVSEGANSMGTIEPTQGVAVTVGASSYRSSDTITLTVLNQLGAAIVATDHHSSCTIVQLQREVGGEWQDEGGCSLGMATRQIPLAAGSSTSVTVAPGAGQMTTKPWSAGTYRVAFTYLPGPIDGTATADGSVTVYSATFTVS